MKRVQDGSDVTCFGSFDNSMSERVLDLLGASYLRLLLRRWSIADSQSTSADTAYFRFTSQLTARFTRQKELLLAHITTKSAWMTMVTSMRW